MFRNDLRRCAKEYQLRWRDRFHYPQRPSWQSGPQHPDNAQFPDAYRCPEYVQHASGIRRLCDEQNFEMAQRYWWRRCYRKNQP